MACHPGGPRSLQAGTAPPPGGPKDVTQEGPSLKTKDAPFALATCLVLAEATKVCLGQVRVPGS